MKEARESIIADERKAHAALFAEQKRENARLNVRIEALVGLLEESRQRTTATETLQKESQRDLSNLGVKVTENREDISTLSTSCCSALGGARGRACGWSVSARQSRL